MLAAQEAKAAIRQPAHAVMEQNNPTPPQINAAMTTANPFEVVPKDESFDNTIGRGIAIVSGKFKDGVKVSLFKGVNDSQYYISLILPVPIASQTHSGRLIRVGSNIELAKFIRTAVEKDNKIREKIRGSTTQDQLDTLMNTILDKIKTFPRVVQQQVIEQTRDISETTPMDETIGGRAAFSIGKERANGYKTSLYLGVKGQYLISLTMPVKTPTGENKTTGRLIEIGNNERIAHSIFNSLENDETFWSDNILKRPKQTQGERNVLMRAVRDQIVNVYIPNAAIFHNQSRMSVSLQRTRAVHIPIKDLNQTKPNAAMTVAEAKKFLDENGIIEGSPLFITYKETREEEPISKKATFEFEDLGRGVIGFKGSNGESLILSLDNINSQNPKFLNMELLSVVNTPMRRGFVNAAMKASELNSEIEKFREAMIKNSNDGQAVDEFVDLLNSPDLFGFRQANFLKSFPH